ncbi:hypothetical protein PTD2_11229 [Pseudoalteromonas tunicata D2]|uniref:Uncharacterized protein n=1 Tax=Pseudoalteromonas tunicata D2 TaxID=87626 RepID=A4C5Y0_9GAMM|nr:hypothetical protein PTD2_11229 [Pseudoalteromonas tunicata D2]
MYWADKIAIICPASNKTHNGGLIGPLATIAGELGQARKGAATACDLCAGMRLVGPPPKSQNILLFEV